MNTDDATSQKCDQICNEWIKSGKSPHVANIECKQICNELIKDTTDKKQRRLLTGLDEYIILHYQA
jgi:hypothetical protein